MNRLPWWLRTLPERALYSLIFACVVLTLGVAWNVLTRAEYTAEQRAEFVSTLRETDNELKKYNEVTEVYFSTLEPKDELEITLEVTAPVDKKYFEDETRRIFYHALTDNWSDTNNIPRFKVKVTLLNRS